MVIDVIFNRNSGERSSPADNDDLVRRFHYLARSYTLDVDDLEAKLLDEAKFKGRSYRPFPVDNRQEIRWILDSLKKRLYDTSPLEQEIAPVEAEFFRIRRNHSAAYTGRLHGLFRWWVLHGYYPDSGKNRLAGFEDTIRKRDYFEAVKNELLPVVDIKKELERLETKDRIFRSSIPECIRKQTYSPLDLWYAPPEIWWRHLEEKYGKPFGFLYPEPFPHL